MQNEPIGLVLEGGGMRGMYTCGVLDVIMEHGLWADAMIGVSAGIAFGCNYKSGQAGRAIRYNMRFSRDRRYSGLGSLLRTGNYYNAEFAYHTVTNEYDVFDKEAFNRSPMVCYAVVTDVDNGQAVYHRIDRADDTAFEWIRASASMPVVAQPVELDGHRYLDGGMADSLPLRFMQEHGYKRNMVVLTREKGYVKRGEHGQWLLSLLLRKQPRVVQALRERPAAYNAQLAYVEQQGELGHTLVVRPEVPLNISRISRSASEMRRVYDLGRAQATQLLPRLTQFFQGH